MLDNIPFRRIVVHFLNLLVFAHLHSLLSVHLSPFVAATLDNDQSVPSTSSQYVFSLTPKTRSLLPEYPFFSFSFLQVAAASDVHDEKPPATIEEVSASTVSGLEHLNSENSLDSPLSTNLEEAVELHLNSVDEKLHEFEREQRMVLCFNVVQKHYMSFREQYITQVAETAKKHGMRQDEAMRLMIHGSLVACYHNLKEEDVDKYAKDTLADMDVMRLMMREATTPARFSARQLQLLEKIISSTQDASTPGFLTIGGVMGQVYMVVVVLITFSLLYFLFNKLVSMQESRGKKAKLLKLEKKTMKKTR